MRRTQTLLSVSVAIGLGLRLGLGFGFGFGASAQAAPAKSARVKADPARVKADPARVALGEVQPSGSVPVRIHLVNRGGSPAEGVACTGRGLQFPAVDVPAGGAADTEATYTAPVAPVPKKPKPISIAIRCGKALVVAKATLVPSAPPSAVVATAPSMDRLLGVWRITSMGKGNENEVLPEGLRITLDFRADGTLIMATDVKGDRNEEKGTWETGGVGQIKITTEGRSTDEFQYTVTATTLTLRKPAEHEILQAER